MLDDLVGVHDVHRRVGVGQGTPEVGVEDLDPAPAGLRGQVGHELDAEDPRRADALGDAHRHHAVRAAEVAASASGCE